MLLSLDTLAGVKELASHDRGFPLGAPPDLSVVVVTAASYDSISRTVESLRRQTIAKNIELVVVAPDSASVSDRLAALSDFHSIRIVAAGPIDNVDHAAAPGLLAAAAEIVASIEDHAFPDSDWAERLLAGWADPGCVAVGSTVFNANPRSALSWTNILIAYGQWRPGTPDGQIDWIASHNTSYRRAALVPFGNNLAPLMGREGLLLKELRARGGHFRFASKARVAHVNPSTLTATAALRFDAGRLYGARRAAEENWPVWKRFFYAALSPLIPFIRYRRMRLELFSDADPAVSERKYGWALFVGLIFDAAGQAAGYLADAGGAPRRLAVFEMDRLQHLTKHDRERFQPI